MLLAALLFLLVQPSFVAGQTDDIPRSILHKSEKILGSYIFWNFEQEDWARFIDASLPVQMVYDPMQPRIVVLIPSAGLQIAFPLGRSGNSDFVTLLQADPESADPASDFDAALAWLLKWEQPRRDPRKRDRFRPPDQVMENRFVDSRSLVRRQGTITLHEIPEPPRYLPESNNAAQILLAVLDYGHSLAQRPCRQVRYTVPRFSDDNPQIHVLEEHTDPTCEHSEGIRFFVQIEPGIWTWSVMIPKRDPRVALWQERILNYTLFSAEFHANNSGE